MRFLRYFSYSLLVIVGSGILLVCGFLWYIELQLPDVEKLKDIHLQVPLKIYSQDRQLIAIYGSKRREPVPLSAVPDLLQKAVLATEDARFYQHAGVDLVGLVRAAVAVIQTGKKVQGASTITMQVARNFYLTRHKTYYRKIKEILLALKIDRNLSKSKILELYLNKIYFGNRAYGVAAAAQVYYGRPLSALTLAEMAMIAGLPQSPSRNNPLENPKAALLRRNHVLTRLLQQGWASRADVQRAQRAPITAQYHKTKIALLAPYVAEMVREWLKARWSDAVIEQGLTVVTTIDAPAQRAAIHALQRGLIAYDHRHNYRGVVTHFAMQGRIPAQQALAQLPTVAGLVPAWVTAVHDAVLTILLPDGQSATIDLNNPVTNSYQLDSTLSSPAAIVPQDVIYVEYQSHGKGLRLSAWPGVQGALVSLDPSSGAVIAVTGGFDYALSNFNRATQAQRQSGSNFKPFLYSAALNKGFTLASLINDAPIVKKDTGENAWWRPNNDTEQFYGPTTLRQGLIRSRNLVSIRLLQAIGVDYALDYLKRFGFDPYALPHSLSLALGTGLVSPLQIAQGYAVFANGGYQVKPYFVDQVVDQKGGVIYKASPKRAPSLNNESVSGSVAPLVITPQNAYLMTNVLKEVITRGTARKASRLHRADLSGKTGTTNDQVDGWFSGYSPKVVTTVWVGFDNLKSLKEYGSQCALPIWMDYMKTILADTPVELPVEPAGLLRLRVDRRTGMPTTKSDKDSYFEIFRQANAPEVVASRNADASQEDDLF